MITRGGGAATLAARQERPDAAVSRCVHGVAKVVVLVMGAAQCPACLSAPTRGPTVHIVKVIRVLLTITDLYRLYHISQIVYVYID